MDETRDIAIRADESSKSAHKRLDSYNGQITAARDEVAALRDDFNEAINDPEFGLLVKITDLTATVRTTLKVAGAIAGAAIAVCVGVTIYALEHATPSAPAAHVTPSSQAAGK